MKINQKLAFWLTLGILLLFTFTPRGYAQATFPYTKKFVVSSYYTPLPNQSRYIRGSYEGDVRLNGEGVHSADGTSVYPGMAAASRDFPFGTKMDIPGFGVVAIHDRGGAIKGDRLDIWMGEGEEGLRRALWWGMRSVDVIVYGIDPNIQESVNIAGIPLADISTVPQRTTYFRVDLAVGDEGAQVSELQRFLKNLGYFKSDITGYFGSETNSALTEFQSAQKVIVTADDPGAGNFGPRSRYALEALLEEKRGTLIKKLPEPGLHRGAKGENVKNLQSALADFGFLNEAAALGMFDDKTFDALVRFQMDAGLVTVPKDFGAGVFGPKTKAALEKIITESYTPSNALITPKSTPSASKRVFAESLEVNDRGAGVALLQEELKRLNFLGLQPTGYYGKTTEHAVFKFQQATGVITDEKSLGAGVVGPKTLEKLNEIASARLGQKKLIATTTEQKEVVAARVNDEKTLIAGALSSSDAFSLNLTYGSRGGDVDRLQKVLKRLGFFPGRFTTEYYGDITKNSVSAFQKNHGLETSGEIDERTRKILNQIVSSPVSS